MFAFDVYRSQSWHDPLLIDDEIERFREVNVDASTRPPRTAVEAYEAWYSNSRVLTMHMIAETLSVSAEFQNMITRNDVKFPLGEVAFVMARYPTIIRTLQTDSSINSSFTDNTLSYLRAFSHKDEGLAWYLLMRVNKWTWGNGTQDSPELMAIVRKLSEGGIGFDQAQPYISAGISDPETIIKAVKNSIDVSLMMSAADLGG